MLHKHHATRKRTDSLGTPILVQAPDPDSDTVANTPTTIYSYDYTAGKTTVESTLIASANHVGSGLPTSADASQTRKTRETYLASGGLLKSERFDSYVDSAGASVAADYLTVVENEFASNSGVLLSSTDADGQQTVYGYDPLTGLVNSVTKPNGETTTFEYDSAGNRTRLHYTGNPSGGGGDTRWVYDALSRQTAETVVGIAASRTWLYEGLVTSYTDRNSVVHQTNINPTSGTRTTTASSNNFDYERFELFASNGALIQVDESLDEANAPVYASSFVYDLDASDLNLTNSYQFNFQGDYLDHTVSIDLDSRGQIDRSTFSFAGLQNSASELWTDEFNFDWIGRQTAVERAIAAVSGDVASIWGNADEPADQIKVSGTELEL